MNTEAKTRSDAPLAIEPYDREWGVGVSGMTEDPSPFPRINKMLKWLKETDSTADSLMTAIARAKTGSEMNVAKDDSGSTAPISSAET